MAVYVLCWEKRNFPTTTNIELLKRSLVKGTSQKNFSKQDLKASSLLPRVKKEDCIFSSSLISSLIFLTPDAAFSCLYSKELSRPLIGQYRSRDLNTGLSLARTELAITGSWPWPESHLAVLLSANQKPGLWGSGQSEARRRHSLPTRGLGNM